jgi:hypothetical protein
MFNKANSVPSAPEQPALQASSKKRFGRKLYVTAAALVVLAVVAAALLIPQGAATIPLNVNFTVGEKMVYNTTEQITVLEYNTTVGQPPEDTIINMTSIVEVVDFDGDYYTLNHTYTIVSGAFYPPSNSFSHLEKINKTGYSTYIFPGGTQTVTNASGNLYLTELLNRSEVKVGDKWTVPLDTGNANFGMTGELTMTFGGFQDITVPAGTYRVFRVDMTSSNLTLRTSASGYGNNLHFAILTQSGTMYMEYGTLRPIKNTMQETVSIQSASVNYTYSLTSQTELVQHIIPMT